MPANRAMEHPAQRHSINDAAEARKDLPNPIPAGNDAQHTADNVLIDLHTESQRDLLSNAGTTPASIAPFHCHYGVDEVFVASLRARPTAAPRRKQHAVLSLAQHTVEMQQSGRRPNDGGTNNT